jgi:hypothetical protein
LYGPLLACVTASKSAYEAMIRQHSPDGSAHTFMDKIRAKPDSREGAIYRFVTLHAFSPACMAPHSAS